MRIFFLGKYEGQLKMSKSEYTERLLIYIPSYPPPHRI